MKDVSVQFADMKRQQEQVTTPTRGIFSTIGTAMDKERRKLNVVVHNLEESQPSETESREKQDLLKFQAFIKDALNLNLRAVKSFRAGKTQEERPRLLVVTLEDSIKDRTPPHVLSVAKASQSGDMSSLTQILH